MEQFADTGDGLTVAQLLIECTAINLSAPEGLNGLRNLSHWFFQIVEENLPFNVDWTIDTQAIGEYPLPAIGWSSVVDHLKDHFRFNADEEDEEASCRIVRDLFGNPFRPGAIAPSWLTPTVLALAQAAYHNRILPAGTLDNAQLAVLADALEDACCDNSDILNHLRQPGVHVRGCWVVDRLLGKE